MSFDGIDFRALRIFAALAKPGEPMTVPRIELPNLVVPASFAALSALKTP
jgi:hypothetical protein